VIEIKRDAVDRAALGQVQDYASCLSEMSEELLRTCLQPHLAARNLDLDQELRARDALDSLDPKDRQVVMFVVGTSRASGLDRMVRFLSSFSVPIYATTFNAFVTSRGDRVLVRETAEGEVPPLPPSSLHDLRANAEAGGFADVFDTIKEAAERHGLQLRACKRSVMFTPPTDARRCLFTLWTTPQRNGLQLYVETKAFAEFFPVTEEDAFREVGERGYRTVDVEGARGFSEGLHRLLGGSAT
jgi:hypothetical protein